ncbi:MAG: hypothetical protein LBM65_05845 [Oscillospiraceae bacterium]|nr:hypothetical protein [Oscillospiraceae bacterium]
MIIKNTGASGASNPADTGTKNIGDFTTTMHNKTFKTYGKRGTRYPCPYCPAENEEQLATSALQSFKNNGAVG